MSDEIAELEATIDQLRDEISEQQRQISDFETDVSGLETELADTNQALDEQTAEVERLETINELYEEIAEQYGKAFSDALEAVAKQERDPSYLDEGTCYDLIRSLDGIETSVNELGSRIDKLKSD